jgi:hypothetical protein
MLGGLLKSDRPFFRTPKQANATRSARLARPARSVPDGGLWFAFGVSQIPNLDGDLPGLMGSPDLSVWVAVLLIQSVPYAAAVIVSIVNAFALPGHWIGEAGLQAAPALAPPVHARSAPLRWLLRLGDQRFLRRPPRR